MQTRAHVRIRALVPISTGHGLILPIKMNNAIPDSLRLLFQRYLGILQAQIIPKTPLSSRFYADPADANCHNL